MNYKMVLHTTLKNNLVRISCAHPLNYYSRKTPFFGVLSSYFDDVFDAFIVDLHFCP